MDLKGFLLETCQSPVDFSKKSNVSIATIYKVLKGCRVGATVAKKIIEATDGKIKSKDLLKQGF